MGCVEFVVGEASHPGPPKSLIRMHLVDHTSRNVVARVSVSPSPRATVFHVDVPSSVPPTVPASAGAVAHVEVAQGDSGRVRVADCAEVVSRRIRRVSSDNDAPAVTRGNRFAVLSESDSDDEPLVRLTGRRRSEDDVITIPASSGAVAAHLEQCETGFQVLSQPLPTSCDGHGSVGESHVRPTEVDIQDTVISSDGACAGSGQGQ